MLRRIFDGISGTTSRRSKAQSVELGQIGEGQLGKGQCGMFQQVVRSQERVLAMMPRRSSGWDM